MPFVWHEQEGVGIIVATGVIRREDVPTLAIAVRGYAVRSPNVRFLCDCTQLKIFAPEATEELLRLMKEHNHLVQRSAFLVPGEGVLALQLRRLVRLAGSPKRRVFTSAPSAWEWLREDATEG
jgi:hypothetical protein